MELDYSFDSSKTPTTDKKLELSAVFHAGSFFCGLWDQGNRLDRVVHYHSFSELASDQQIHPDKTRFGLLNSHFTLVPESMFTTEEMEIYIRHACQLVDSEQFIFRSDYSEQFNLRVVYAIRRSTVKQLNSHFKSPSLVHLGTSFLDTLTRLTFDTKIHVLVHSGKALVALTRGSGLLLLNLFTTYSDTDLLYFLSLIIKRFELNPAEVQIELSGTVRKEDDLFKTISRYFGGIRMKSLKLANSRPDNHAYHSIHSVLQCA